MKAFKLEQNSPFCGTQINKLCEKKRKNLNLYKKKKKQF